jgi:hypothetical protein
MRTRGKENCGLIASLFVPAAAKNYEQRMALRQTWLQNEQVGIAPYVKEEDGVCNMWAREAPAWAIRNRKESMDAGARGVDTRTRGSMHCCPTG